MAIVRQIPEYTAPYEVMMNLFPDQFIGDNAPLAAGVGESFTIDGKKYPMPYQHVSKQTKENPGWWKVNMDYFYTVALAQYSYHYKKVDKNYNLLKGKLSAEDFYIAEKETPVFDLVDKLMKESELPKYVVHYDIMKDCIDMLVGEMSKRPVTARPKAMDDESKSEELKFYTDLYLQLITETAKQKVVEKLTKQGVDTSNQEEFQKQVNQLTEDQIADYKTNFTSEAELWATKTLEALKVEFDMKEKSEEGFRDLNICNAEFFEIREDKSRTGLRADCLNKKKVWFLTTPDKKYTRDAYASGTIDIMELSEILDEIDLDENEIMYLRQFATEAFFPYSQLSNALRSDGGGKGINSITYNPYDPAIVRERNKLESAFGAQENQQQIDGLLANAAPNTMTFGNRFVVTRAYWKSKRRVGLLTYIDIKGVEQTEIVDDNYHDGDHPKEISIEWDWKNQWYQGIKIEDIYIVKPFELLDRNPIIGVTHEIKNSISASNVDMMKPLQTIFNVCWNQVFHLLETEPGRVLLMNKRFMPILQGADMADTEHIFMEKISHDKVIWIDDSPTNVKGGSSFNQFQIADWTFTQQIESRINIANSAKMEARRLMGITDARQGVIPATQTATGTNTQIAQSYAQTEPLFVQHEYLMNQVYQAIIDAAKYVACKNPESTITFINSEGGNSFCQIQTSSGLSNKDIKLFVTSGAEDMRIWDKLQQLAAPMLQQGTSAYEVAQLFTTQSTRKYMDNLKKLKEFNENMMKQKQDMEQKAQEMDMQKHKEEQDFKEKQHQEDIQVKIYEIDTKANTELTVAKIKESFAHMKGNNEPDLLSIAKQNMDYQKMIHDRDLANIKLEFDKTKSEQEQRNKDRENDLKNKKLEVEKENIRSKTKIAEKQLAQRNKSQS